MVKHLLNGRCFLHVQHHVGRTGLRTQLKLVFTQVIVVAMTSHLGTWSELFHVMEGPVHVSWLLFLNNV